MGSVRFRPMTGRLAGSFSTSSPFDRVPTAWPRFGRLLSWYWLAGVGEDVNYEYAIPLPRATPGPPKMRKRDQDRADTMRLAGGPKPSLRERAVALARQRGTVRTRDLTAIGVPRCYLARLCEEGLLMKVGYGLYRAADREAA